MHFKNISGAFACQSGKVLTLNHLPADSPGLLLIPYLLLSHLSIMRHSSTCQSCSHTVDIFVIFLLLFIFINSTILNCHSDILTTFADLSRVIHYCYL